MTASPKSIGILSGNHLCRNPRVVKEASSLARAGFDVEVLGAWTDARLKTEDQAILSGESFRFTPVVDTIGARPASRLRRIAARALSKGARPVWRSTGFQSRWQLGPVVGALGRAARMRRFDLAIAHSEPALAVAADLLRFGRRVGVDFEDWFSEDLLPEARRNRPLELLRRLERRALRSGSYASCPSRAMSEGLAKAYDCAGPTVIYNAFPWADRTAIDGLSKDREGRTRPSIHWYSQTLGLGRGLEDLLASLPMVRSEAEVHLRGSFSEGFESWLRERIPEAWRDRFFLHGLVSNAELLSRIAEHDIGFAGETKDCESRNLTVTNKVLHYLLAGLAIVASDTVGQREIAAQAPTAVSVYTAGDPRALAERINALLGPSQTVHAAKVAALASAEAHYCWERQEAHLVSAIGSAVLGPTG